MDIRIRNVMGVEKADIGLSAITLVGGHNGAGKSSLLEAVACAVTGTPLARGVATKGKASVLLREGTEAGSATIAGAGWSSRVSWPDAKVETKGQVPPLGTPLGIGARRWMDLDGKQRMAELATRLALEPTEQDILAWLRKREHVWRDEDGKDITSRIARDLFAKIDNQGWDAVLKIARESVTKKRGAWEHVTGEAFGIRKAPVWRPRVLEADETYTVDACEAAVRAARAHYEEMLTAGAVSDAEIQAMEVVVATIPDLQLAADTAEREKTRIEAVLERELGALERLPPIEPPPGTAECPYCKNAIFAKPVAGRVGEFVIAPAPKIVGGAKEIAAAKAKRTGLQNAIADLQEGQAAALAEQTAALRALDAAQKTAAELAIAKAKPKADDKALGEAKAALTEAEVIRDAVKAMNEAKKLWADIERSLPLIDALEPSGVRAARVAQGLAEFNADLAALSKAAGFRTVQVSTEDASCTLGGRPYALLSESERWRCDLIVAASLARREKAAVFLVDRLDILNPQARPGVIMLLKDLGIPSLVGMTAKNREAMPALEQHNLGKCIWIEAGKVAE